MRRRITSTKRFSCGGARGEGRGARRACLTARPTTSVLLWPLFHKTTVSCLNPWNSNDVSRQTVPRWTELFPSRAELSACSPRTFLQPCDGRLLRRCQACASIHVWDKRAHIWDQAQKDHPPHRLRFAQAEWGDGQRVLWIFLSGGGNSRAMPPGLRRHARWARSRSTASVSTSR